MKILIALPAFLLAGCAQLQPQITFTSDGKQGYSVKCVDTAYGIGSCYEQARNICGASGYEITQTKEISDGTRSMQVFCKA
ncbi:MAG: hypothetical protein JWQ21_1345 [Herminiimonas sp.]|jgi:hypothetical protein|nr:hypothetical protein [Herminiimonas sp.]